MTERRTIVFLLHERFEIIDLTGPAAVFGGVRRPGGGPAYRQVLVTRLGRPARSGEGIVVAVDGSPACVPGRVDTVVVPGGFAVDEAAADGAFLHELRGLAARTRRLVSVCSGSLVLAAAGLLDGRRATTHWAATDLLARRHPAVDVVRDVVWVRDGHVWTSAGATTGIDLALALVEGDHGPAAARAVARLMVLGARRSGARPQHSVRASLPEPATAALRRALDLAAEQPAADLSVAALAAQAAMSPRHFHRVFTNELGVTPARYVERLRVEAAADQLELSGATLDVIARACGFGSTETMRRAFQRVLGTPPGAYRRTVAKPNSSAT